MGIPGAAMIPVNVMSHGRGGCRYQGTLIGPGGICLAVPRGGESIPESGAANRANAGSLVLELRRGGCCCCHCERDLDLGRHDGTVLEHEEESKELLEEEEFGRSVLEESPERESRTRTNPHRLPLAGMNQAHAWIHRQIDLVAARVGRIPPQKSRRLQDPNGQPWSALLDGATTKLEPSSGCATRNGSSKWWPLVTPPRSCGRMRKISGIASFGAWGGSSDPSSPTFSGPKCRACKGQGKICDGSSMSNSKELQIMDV
ncbi:hypothetical protein SELMODRAFT_414663 [Selaginella moellendorffii]|uniref:Uncharacterized protein n=1 Tax=Selaginella moellendorffii TaxID=88036 RepID=D8RTI6_SELML|nr:hypothetical protein SELMODRAFT_414663 [Selaginella moellendorffii]